MSRRWVGVTPYDAWDAGDAKKRTNAYREAMNSPIVRDLRDALVAMLDARDVDDAETAEDMARDALAAYEKEVEEEPHG